jgi:uncharacterized double-CXXCG motif protein
VTWPETEVKLFNINWLGAGNPGIEGEFKWSLPGVKCSRCGTWGAVGSEYPAIDLSRLTNVKPYIRPRAVSLAEFGQLQRAIQSFLPTDCPLPPGTDFGRFEGRALARLGDFAWARQWTPFITETALLKLESELGEIETVPADIKATGKFNSHAKYHCLHVEPSARLHSSCIAERDICPLCGRSRVKLAGRLIIDSASVPHERQIFRVVEFKTYIVVTEEVRNAVMNFGLSDISFSELEAI